jgi:hypothetical protein
VFFKEGQEQRRDELLRQKLNKMNIKGSINNVIDDFAEAGKEAIQRGIETSEPLNTKDAGIFQQTSVDQKALTAEGGAQSCDEREEGAEDPKRNPYGAPE